MNENKFSRFKGKKIENLEKELEAIKKESKSNNPKDFYFLTSFYIRNYCKKIKEFKTVSTGSVYSTMMVLDYDKYLRLLTWYLKKFAYRGKPKGRLVLKHNPIGNEVWIQDDERQFARFRDLEEGPYASLVERNSSSLWWFMRMVKLIVSKRVDEENLEIMTEHFYRKLGQDLNENFMQKAKHREDNENLIDSTRNLVKRWIVVNERVSLSSYQVIKESDDPVKNAILSSLAELYPVQFTNWARFTQMSIGDVDDFIIERDGIYYVEFIDGLIGGKARISRMTSKPTILRYLKSNEHKSLDERGARFVIRSLHNFEDQSDDDIIEVLTKPFNIYLYVNEVKEVTKGVWTCNIGLYTMHTHRFLIKENYHISVHKTVEYEEE